MEGVGWPQSRRWRFNPRKPIGSQRNRRVLHAAGQQCLQISSRCAATAASTAERGEANAAHIPSPVCLNNQPPCASIAPRSTKSCAASATRIASASASHRRVEPSTSVNRNVTTPEGAAAGGADTPAECHNRDGLTLNIVRIRQRHPRLSGRSADPRRSISRRRRWHGECAAKANQSPRLRPRSALAGQLCIACWPRRQTAGIRPLNARYVPLMAA
jgi:hypothetical protein